MSLPFTRDQFFDVLAAWFSPTGSVRHVFAWTLIIYGLLYPLLASRGPHVPRGPTFAVPCPTTILTIGWLLATDASWPAAVAGIPMASAIVGGSAAALFDVRKLTSCCGPRESPSRHRYWRPPGAAFAREGRGMLASPCQSART
jgi:hypothetical protein